MTRKSTKQRGVTLVEVTLTLAISTLLIATVLTGRNSIRSQAQFSDGMERIKETILSVKSEANTGNNTNPGAKGTAQIGSGTNRYLNLGRSIRFTPNSSTADSLALLCYAASDLTCTDQLNPDTATVKRLALPWGIAYKDYTAEGVTGATITIIFTRDDQTGEFAGYWYDGTIANRDSKNAVLVKQRPVTLNFESPDGRKATIAINPATGTVTRTIL
jgi:type II secretory pathway pseudopilin PulG